MKAGVESLVERSFQTPRPLSMPLTKATQTEELPECMRSVTRRVADLLVEKKHWYARNWTYLTGTDSPQWIDARRIYMYRSIREKGVSC